MKIKKHYTGLELFTAEFPPLKWTVPGIIPEGMSFLAGKPKMGKSLIALDICLSVATNTACFDTLQIETPGAALYISFEDGPRRQQTRLRHMISDMRGIENLHLYYEWPKMGKGGIAQIRDFHAIHGLKFLVIDTFQLFRPPPGKNGYNYSSDYEHVHVLMKLAQELGISILVLHHLRKADAEDIMDTLNGSMGISGGADGILALERKNTQDPNTILHVTGKDIESTKHSLTFDKKRLLWMYDGENGEEGNTELQTEILKVLKNSNVSMSPAQIGEKLKIKNTETVRQNLRRLTKRGEVVNPAYGKYMAPK